MLHKATILQYISEQIGMGVFATQDIPIGTIIVARDAFDIVISKDSFNKLSATLISNAETYMYHDKNGNLILSWDNAKYMNHNCYPNTMITDYNFEIVIRDIKAGDEITTEYGLLNVQEDFNVYCGCPNCRKIIRTTDIDNYHQKWDELIYNAIKLIPKVDQPLWNLLNVDLQKEILKTADSKLPYRSITNLKWRQN